MNTWPLLALTLLTGGGWFTCTSWNASAADIRLTGLARWNGSEIAFLEEKVEGGRTNFHVLRGGQREGNVEVFAIHCAEGRVELRTRDGVISQAGFDRELPAEAWVTVEETSDRGAGGPFLRFQGVNASQVYAAYAQVTQRSIIRPSALPNFTLDLGCRGARTPGDLARAIENALAPKGIGFKGDGEKFVLVGKPRDLEKIQPELLELASRLVPNSTEALPPGAIQFPGTDIRQVIRIYQELANRTVLAGEPLPATLLSFASQTALTRTEATYALQAVLAMNGVSVAPAGEKFVFVFPTVQKEKAEQLLGRVALRTTKELNSQSAPPGSINFSNPDASQVLKLYGKAAGKSVVASDIPLRPPLILRSQTALTPAEMLYAMDLLLGWQGMEVQTSEDGQTLKLVRMEQKR